MAVSSPGLSNLKEGFRKDKNEKKILWLIRILAGKHRNLARARLSRYE